MRKDLFDPAIDFSVLFISIETIHSMTSDTLLESAIANFTVADTDQNERDDRQLVDAVASGQIKAIQV